MDKKIQEAKGNISIDISINISMCAPILIFTFGNYKDILLPPVRIGKTKRIKILA